MTCFNEKSQLEELLESVTGAEERFISVILAVTERKEICEKLEQYLRSERRSQEEAWREIAALCKLEIHKLEGGRSLIYPRAGTVRFCVDVRQGPIGSGSLKRFSPEEACLFGHLDCDDISAWELLFDYLEADAAASHYESAFILSAAGKTPCDDICLARGYLPSERKAQEELCRCLGCYIIYDEVLSKRL